MPTLTYNYVYFANGPHLRQPRTISGSGFAVLESIQGGSPATGGTFVAGAQPGTLLVNGTTYAFGFVNITGGTPAGQTSFQSNVPPPAITVGTAPINVLVVYVPVGGGPGGGSGATIDAFDESTGSLFNDTFVTVAPDLGGTLTASGNVDGYVSTANAETITALSVTSPTGVDFDRWVVLAGGGTANGSALAVAGGASDSALAFYKTPPPEPPAEVSCDQTVASLQQMVLLGPNGPLFTPTEWTAVQASLHKCVLEGYLTQAKATQLIAEYNAYAKNHGATKPPIHVL